MRWRQRHSASANHHHLMLLRLSLSFFLLPFKFTGPSLVLYLKLLTCFPALFFKVIRQHWSGRTRGSALWAGSSRTLSREWRERALDEREEEAERDKEREGEAKQESKQRDRSRCFGSPSLGWETRIWVFSRSHLEKQLMGLFSWRAAHISPPIVSTWRLLSLNYGGF